MAVRHPDTSFTPSMAVNASARSALVNVAETFWERQKWPDLHIIETHSPQSSSSFNMLGKFDFSDEKGPNYGSNGSKVPNPP